MKQVAVIGLGQFGSQLALSLSELDCEVLAIDRNEARLAQVRDKVSRVVILDARDYDALSSVITPELDEVVVSLGESMEASVLCTLHLKKIGVKYIRAKATNEDHATILRAVGADQVIFPERETAQRVAAHMVNPNLLDFIPLSPEYRVVEVVPPAGFRGKSLIELDLRKKFNVFVIAIKETDTGKFIFLPGPDFVLKEKDVMVAIGTQQAMSRMTQAKK